MSLRFTSSVIILAFVTLPLIPVAAQDTGTGTLMSVIVDPAVGCSERKSLRHRTATQQTRSSTTDASGNYIFVTLPFGSYDVTVTARALPSFDTGLTVSRWERLPA